MDMELNRQPLAPENFKYQNETVLGFVPFILNQTSWGLCRWMAVATSAALYFVYCGYERSIFVSGKEKKLEAELQGKNLQQLLESGEYFYRITPNLSNNLVLSKSWLTGNKAKLKKTTEGDLIITLKTVLFNKVSELAKAARIFVSDMPAEPQEVIYKQTIKNTQAVAMTEEEFKQEKRRKKTLAFVLLGNSFINLGLTIFIAWKGGEIDALSGANFAPSIVDFVIAMGLFAQKDLVGLVFYRSLLGMLIWTGVLLGQRDWLSAIAQFSFSLYLLYHAKAKPSSKTFRIALGLLFSAIVFMVVSFAYNFNAGQKESLEFDNKLTATARVLNENYKIESDLVYTDIKDYSNQEVQDLYTKINTQALKNLADLKQALAEVDEGLKKYPNSKSQENLLFLKSLYDAETSQNQAVLELSNFVLGLDLQNMTEQQKVQLEQEYDKVDKAYKNVHEKSLQKPGGEK